MELNILFPVLGVVFGIIAGIMIFLISYIELSRHYVTKDIPFKSSLKSAIVTLVFFFVLGLLLGIFSDHF